MPAAKQMQKTRLAATTTKTAITQKQSLEIVQTLLHGGLSSLSYLRCFFADKAFDEQLYEMSSRVPSYRDYANGKLPPKRSGVAQTVMQVLRRGRSQRADMFLDWLETVAFAALKDGTLRALQIYVHTDPEDREKVVETYTFTVKYHINQQSGQTIAGLEVESPGGPPLTVEATNAALQDMLRDIMRICTHLPDLPEKRYLSMTLHYLQDGDEGYQPPKGFEPSTSKQLRFASADGWERTSAAAKELHSSFHSATLRVTHLHQPAFDGMSGIMQATRIPTNLEYNDVVLKETELETMTPSGEDDATITPSTIAPSEFGTVNGGGIETPAATSQARTAIAHSPAVVSENGDTQTSNVPRMKSALQGFMLPERLTQGDTQSQRLMRPPPPRTETPIAKTLATGKSDVSEKMLLLPEVASKLEKDQAKLRQTALKLAKPSASRDKGADIVLCQCGHLEEEGGEMIGCSYCDTWQHFHCYGFTGPDDPRIPEDHACYQCLLAGSDDDALSALNDLALNRRGMSFALRVGLWRKGNLGKTMDVDTAVGYSVHDYLRKEGFVVNVYKSHKPGFAATGKPLFIPVTEGPAHEKLIRDLFDPLLHVQKYYATTPMPLDLIGRQLYALRSSDMPAPATPQQKKGTATPASNLDIRPSMTPYETPVLSRFPPRKRPSDDQGIFDTPAKRHSCGTPLYHRLKSIQTAFILNADGLSSSPAINNR